VVSTPTHGRASSAHLKLSAVKTVFREHRLRTGMIMSSAIETKKGRRADSWWVLLAVPLGLTTWAAFLYAGIRTKRRSLLAFAALYAATLTGWLVLDAGNRRGAPEAVGAILAIVTWIGGLAHALAIRRRVALDLDIADSPAMLQATRELERRTYGRELLSRNPALARQVGVGRPDVANCDSYGLIDVNHASAAILATLPGMSNELAGRTAEFCAAGGSFVSVEDLGLFLDLPAAAVDALREQAVFIKNP
jgi:hypothetical protein